MMGQIIEIFRHYRIGLVYQRTTRMPSLVIGASHLQLGQLASRHHQACRIRG
jgi:hypothetical protein